MAYVPCAMVPLRCCAMAEPALPVTFVSSHAQLGGSESALETLLNGLEEGWCAGIVCLQEGPLVDRLRSAGRRVSVVPTGTSFRDIVRTAWRVRPLLHDALLIHANGVKAAVVAALATMPKRHPALVWNKHDFSFDGPVGRAVARRCACVVGVSNAVIESVRQATDTALIPPAIALPARQESPRSHLRCLLQVDPETPVLLMAGRLDVAKGHLHLLEALPRLVEEIPGLVVAFVGGAEPTQPHYQRHLKERADALGVAENLRMMGHRVDAQRLIAGADAVAVLSHPVRQNGMGQEGFGLVALEALALGTPVVAYDAGGVPEVVGDAAVLVPVADQERLIRGVLSVLRNQQLVADLSANGRARAEQFRLDSTVQRWRETYAAYAKRPAS